MANLLSTNYLPLLTGRRILEVGPPKVGDDKPAFVRAEITLDVSRLNDSVRRDWDSLRPDDVVFLLAVRAADEPHVLSNGHATLEGAASLGLSSLRAAEIVQILDDNGRSIRDVQGSQSNGHFQRPRVRRMIVRLDALTYKVCSPSTVHSEV